MTTLKSLPAVPLASLLTSVKARPEDDAPRLALADWLESQGDPRAEFIRIQVERARPENWTVRHDDFTRPNDAWLRNMGILRPSPALGNDNLERANRAGLRQYQAAWLGLAVEGVSIAWGRGLPVVSVTEDVVLAGWPEPIRHALEEGWVVGLEWRLTAAPVDDILAAARARADVAARLGQFTRVRVANYGVSADALRATEQLAELLAVDIAKVVCDDASVEHLLGLKKLRELPLSGAPQGFTPQGPAGVAGPGLARLGESGVLDSLKHFAHGNCRLTDGDLEHVGRARGLESLELRFHYASGLLKDGVTLAPQDARRDARHRGQYVKRSLIALESCQKLRSLTLWNVELPGGVWPLASLSELRHLAVNSCHILDNGLKPLSLLTNLEDPSLYGSPITGSGLPHLPRMPRLRRLSFDFCKKLRTGCLEALADYPALETLILACNAMKPTDLTHLARLTNLRRLDLTDSKFVGNDWHSSTPIEELTALRQLEWLSLPKSSDPVRILHSFPALRHLKLYGTVLYARSSEDIATLANLRHLDLGFSTLGDECWETLGRLTQLESLDLYSATPGDGNLRHLGKLESLVSLDLELCGITDKGLPHLRSLPLLETLNLDQNFVTPEAVWRNFPRVQVKFHYEE